MKLGTRLKRALRNRRARTKKLGAEYRKLRRQFPRSKRTRAAKAAWRRSRGKEARWERALRALRRRLAIDRASNRLWGGSRQVTNEIIRIVGGRAPITSRKRVATFGNPGSDHHVSQLTADAVDFGIANAHWLADEIARRLGGPSDVSDFQHFQITRNGKTFRVQTIAGTHGTGPHLHVGVRRA